MRILNDKGIELFTDYLETGAAGTVPYHLLTGEETSKEFSGLSGGYPAVTKDCNKETLSKAISSVLSGCDINKLLYDRNLWASFALNYFDNICPLQPDTTREVGRLYRYIPPASRNYREYYRHLIRTPVWLNIHYGALAKYLLMSMPHKGGDFIEQLASRQEIVTNKGIMGLAGKLYFDEAKNRIKVGSTSSKSPGGLRRFVIVMQQLELTFDLHAMNPENLMNLLPKEFEPWVPELKDVSGAL